MSEEPRLQVLIGDRLVEERIGEKVDLADRKIIRRTPMRIESMQLAQFKWGATDRRHGASRSPDK